MKWLLGIARGIDRVNAALGRWVIWTILAAVLVSAGNAVVRKLFNYSSNAWLEAQWYLYGAAFMIGASLVLQQNEHIRIDIIYGQFSRRVQHWIDLAGHLLFLMPFVLLMDFALVPWVLGSVRSGEMSASAGGLILWPAKSLLLLGFAQLTAQGLAEILKKIAVIRGLIPDPHPFVSVHAAAEAEGAALVEELR